MKTELNKNVLEYSFKIMGEINKSLQKISKDQAINLLEKILNSERIYILGCGRTGLVMRTFAMRLMQMGLKTFVVGDTTTPSIQKGDLLLMGSGSGETESTFTVAMKAKKMGIDTCLITIFPNSTIGKITDLYVEIPASTVKVKKKSEYKTIQMEGTVFEQALFIFLDTLVVLLMKEQNKDSDALFKLHANLE